MTKTASEKNSLTPQHFLESQEVQAGSMTTPEVGRAEDGKDDEIRTSVGSYEQSAIPQSCPSSRCESMVHHDNDSMARPVSESVSDIPPNFETKHVTDSEMSCHAKDGDVLREIDHNAGISYSEAAISDKDSAQLNLSSVKLDSKNLVLAKTQVDLKPITVPSTEDLRHRSMNGADNTPSGDCVTPGRDNSHTPGCVKGENVDEEMVTLEKPNLEGQQSEVMTDSHQQIKCGGDKSTNGLREQSEEGVSTAIVEEQVNEAATMNGGDDQAGEGVALAAVCPDEDLSMEVSEEGQSGDVTLIKVDEDWSRESSVDSDRKGEASYSNSGEGSHSLGITRDAYLCSCLK